MTQLTIREGDGDSSRTGYWVVTGRAPENDLFGHILLHVGDVYSWEIQQRVPWHGGMRRNRLETIARSVGTIATHAEAFALMADAWPEPLTWPTDHNDA